ncbi:MAG: hypothetical protein AAF328_09570, partial [Planctomycetota bacterium]
WAVRGAEAEAQRDARVMGLGHGAPAGFGGAGLARVLWQVKQDVVWSRWSAATRQPPEDVGATAL